MITTSMLALLGVLLDPLQQLSVSQAPETIEDVVARVVVLDSVLDDGRTQRGAGLVVGVQGDSVLILTATHVVLSGEVTPKAIETYFSWDQDRRTRLRIVDRDANAKMDVAIVALDDPSMATILREQPLLCHREPREEEEVTIIGHRQDGFWTVARGERILSLQLGGDTRRFTTTSAGLARGNSGGPVLGADGCLLGIVTDQDANEAQATSAAQALALAGNNANLMGGRSGLDRRARRETFGDVSTAINLYLFSVEALPAVFKRSYLDAEELARTITAYNDSYAALYHGRTSMAARLGEQFGGAIGRSYVALLNKLDAAHKSEVYIALNDAVTMLKHEMKLSPRRVADLKKTLRVLDDVLPRLRSYTDDFLFRLQPLVASLVGER